MGWACKRPNEENFGLHGEFLQKTSFKETLSSFGFTWHVTTSNEKADGPCKRPNREILEI